MRIWISSLTLAVIAAGCSTSQPEKAPEPAPGPAEAPVAKPAAPEAARPQSGSEWEELLNKLKSKHALKSSGAIHPRT